MTTRSNPGWSNRLAATLKSTLPKTMHEEMKTVESEAKRIVYLGHPHHLNRRTGRLQASITTDCTVSGTEITASVGTAVPYARSHELGAVIPHSGRSVSVIPARPFLVPAFSAKKHDVLQTTVRRTLDVIRSECK